MKSLLAHRFLVSTLFVAALLRLFRLDFQNLWVDEMMSVHVAMPQGHTIWQLTSHNIHGPLHTFVLHLFTLLGSSDWWLRFPSALAGTASVWLMYRWAAEICNRKVARAGAILLAMSPLHIYYSQEVRNYAFVVFFALLSSYLLERLIRREGYRGRVGYAASVAAALLSNFSAAFLFAAQTVDYFVRKRVLLASVRTWAFVGIVVVILTSPWIYRVYENIDVSDLVTPVQPEQLDASERLRGETTVSLTSVPYAAYAFSVGFTLGPSLRELHEDSRMASVIGRHGLAVAWVALLFGSLAIMGFWKARREGFAWTTLLLYLVVPVAGTLILNWQNAKAFNVRYVLVALPAFLVILACGVNAFSGWRRVVVWGLVTATVAVSLSHHYFDPRYHKEDVRAAVRYVEERIASNECFFAPTVRDVAARYYQGAHEITSLFRGALSQQQLEKKLDGKLLDCHSIWYLRARPWVLDPDGALLERIAARREKLEIKTFEGVTVFHFASIKPTD